jgi:hypothetical protein
MAQARHAPSTASAGQMLPTCAPPADPVGQLSTTAPATMAPMPSAMRRSKFSRNANQASSSEDTFGIEQQRGA